MSQQQQRFILITGGLGYIGSHTAAEILKDGEYGVIIIDNLSNSFSSVFESINTLVAKHYKLAGKDSKPVSRFINVDYRDSAAIKTILDTYAIKSDQGIKSQITGVIHFAASKSVPDSISSPLEYYMNNVSGLVDFCAILRDYEIRNIVFSSSAAVYGGTADKVALLREEHCVHQTEHFVDDDGKQQTVEAGSVGLTCPYSRTKWMCEAILSDLCFSDPAWNIIALRYFNPISCDASGALGEQARGIPTNLLPVVTSVMTGQRPMLDVFGSDYPTRDGTGVRDFIHVSDLASGHLKALKAMAEGKVKGQFRTFNLGSSNGYSVLEVIRAMEKISNKPIAFQLVDRRPGDIPSCVAKNTRAQAELGWKPERSLETCSKDLYNYLVLHGKIQANNATPGKN